MRDEENMDELFTKVWKDESTRWKIFFIFINALFSILCALITQNIVLTIIYIIIVAFIDVCVAIYPYINLEKRINKILTLKAYIYLFFIFFASLPTFFGIVKKEIEISENLFSNLFANLFPNILGSLIVCSIINHITKFDYKQIVFSLMKEKKNYINIFIRIVFLGCFLNAVNYDVNEKWNWVNFFNSIYLFIIIFCGGIVLYTFVIRIIDNQYFGYTIKEVYPTMTLIVGMLFLLSCGIGPLFFKTGKHEPILLTMNSITACIIVIFLLVFLSRRTENKSNAYPFKIVLTFITVASANCIYNFYKWDKSGDWTQQLLSGGVIMVGVLTALLCANKIQKSKTKND